MRVLRGSSAHCIELREVVCGVDPVVYVCGVMGRTAHEIWELFGKPYKCGDGVSKYVKCLACDTQVTAAVNRLKVHWERCKKRPRAIGQLDAGFVPSKKVATGGTVASSASGSLMSGAAGSDLGAPLNFSSFLSGSRGGAHFDHLTREEHKLNMLFARAVLRPLRRSLRSSTTRGKRSLKRCAAVSRSRLWRPLEGTS